MTPAQKKAKDLLDYLTAHPEQRFWQAIRNVSGFSFIFYSNRATHDEAFLDASDTFYLKD